jgi:hypothetical protein
MSPNYTPELTGAERASLLRACHCEEGKLHDSLNHHKDQVSLGHPGAAAKLAVVEAELEILHAAIRKLWLA